MRLKPFFFVLPLSFAVTFSDIQFAYGQVLSPDAPSPSAGAGNGGMSPRGGRGGGPSQSSAPASSSPRTSASTTPGASHGTGTDVPIFDPGSEVIMWDGRAWNVTNNRLFRARFEKYLAAPPEEAEADAEYRKILQEILDLLSPNRSGGPSVATAFARLPEASVHPIDARLCDSLANAIWGVLQTQRSNQNTQAAIAAMDKRRREIERNVELKMEGSPLQARPSGGGGGRGGNQQMQGGRGGRGGPQRQGGGGGAPSSSQGMSSSDVSMNYGTVSGYLKDILELEAMKKIQQSKIGATEMTAKLEFQALIVQFFLQRRFEHVIIGCRFYRNIFGDGDSKLYVKDGSDVSKMFSQGLGVSPTIATLDSFANEAIRDIDEAVKAFQNLVGQKDLHSASERLSEAFVLGEYMPRVRSLPTNQRQQVLAYVRASNQLLSAMEVKDYALAEQLVTAMRSAARDFDYSKPKAAIETAKTVSDMHLNRVKVAAMKGDEATVEIELRSAAEIWPTNPKIRELSDQISGTADIRAQALIDFDRLISQRNYRQIFMDQGRYAGAVLDDPERQKQLAEVVETMTKIQMVLEVSKSLENNGQIYSAYEQVERIYQEFPEDAAVSKARSDLAVRAASFVSALERANEMESRGQYSSSLGWFLKARNMFQGSEMAGAGIQRVLDKIAGESSIGQPRNQTPSPAEAVFAPQNNTPPPQAQTGQPTAAPSANTNNGSF